ncbi:MAG: tail fiber domain-containing protein [Beijerinckiaceae bacterium]
MGKKAPAAPDPYQTAAAQGGMNMDTAITQQFLNSGTQVNPWGTVSTDQTGSSTFVDSQGKTITVPKFTQTTTLSGPQQAIFDQSQAAQGNLAGIAKEQSAFLKDYLNKPFEFKNSDAEQWAFDLASPRIRQNQMQNEDMLRSTLANKGIREGSPAWNAEMGRMTMANTDQMNQLALTGRGQAFSEAMATRNQPLNEITALLSGSQVSNPATMSGAMPQAGVAGVDYTGLVNQKYQADMANYQNKLGGLFGLGSAAIGLFSDRRLKRDIRRVGQTDAGVPLYAYRYIWGGPVHIGVMAQDVPEAAFVTESGFLAVRYEEVH